MSAVEITPYSSPFEMNILLQDQEHPITMEMIQEVLCVLAGQADSYQESAERLRA